MLNNLLDPAAFSALLQVIMIDIVLAGDNAVAVGLAAAGLPLHQRRTAIFCGLAAAVVARISFAVLTTQLLGVVGLLFGGGLLLLGVGWKMWRELRDQAIADEAAADAALDNDPATEPLVKPKSFREALTQILIADVAMSLDNVLAVAGAAREHPTVLILGLLVSVALMGIAAHAIAHLLHRFRWIGYVGVLIVFYVALHMMWQGYNDVVRDIGPANLCKQIPLWRC
ncbi:MAG: YjbE family putative metal transport protein [Alphaproteobacteria bacterium]